MIDFHVDMFYEDMSPDEDNIYLQNFLFGYQMYSHILYLLCSLPLQCS